MSPVRTVLIVLTSLCASLAARANTTVELIGRVSSASLNTGPWAGVRVGEYVHLTYELVPSIIIDPLHARHYSLVGYNPSIPGAQVNEQVKVTVRGQTLNLRMTSASNPAVIHTNDYPVADVHMFSIAGDGTAILATPGSPPVVQYLMPFELHDSSGHAWNAADITQCLGSSGPGTFDYVEWSVSTLSGAEGFGITMERMVIRDPADVTGACCLGDSWCAITTAAACIGGPGAWTAGAACGSVTCTPAGACCKPAGSCELLTHAACAAITNAIYNGDNTACSSFSCPPTGGCCIAGSCSLLIETACTATGGVWQGPGTNCAIQPQHSSPTLNAPLPDATGGFGGNPLVHGVYANSITLSDPALVQSVEVWLSILEPRVNDYYVRITGPNGVTLDLVDRIGSPSPCTGVPIGPGYVINGVVIFQDSAPQTLHSYVLSLPLSSLITEGRYRASACAGTPVLLDAPSPAGFGGIPIAGTWTIEIRDERTGVAGTLRAWALSFNGGNSPPCVYGCHGADIDGDGSVTPSDVASFINTWFDALQHGTLAGDYDHDGSVQPADIATFINAWFDALNSGGC